MQHCRIHRLVPILSRSFPANLLDIPKSPMQMFSTLMRILAGLMSRCTVLMECKYFKPCKIWQHITEICSSLCKSEVGIKSFSVRKGNDLWSFPYLTEHDFMHTSYLSVSWSCSIMFLMLPSSHQSINIYIRVISLETTVPKSRNHFLHSIHNTARCLCALISSRC